MNQVTKNVFVETGYRGCNPGFVVLSKNNEEVPFFYFLAPKEQYKKQLIP
jgi:hypothetical protein